VGKLDNGPFETEREARSAAHQVVRPERGWSILHKSRNRFVLEQACEAARVELGAYDRLILDWLSGFEDSICAVIRTGRPRGRCRPSRSALRHVRPDERPPLGDVLRPDRGA
jgi:hypothetical protein